MKRRGSRSAISAARVLVATLPALALAQPASRDPGCGTSLTGAQRVAGTSYVLAFAPQPAPWSVGSFVTLDVEVCPRPGVELPTSLRVDARMPEHGHGMNYRPSVTSIGRGRWRAEGLMLHMEGRWELSFNLGPGERAEQIKVDLQLR